MEHNKLVSAYQEAAKRLKYKYPEDFREILYVVYEERSMIVRKRLTKSEVLENNIADAKKLLIEQGYTGLSLI